MRRLVVGRSILRLVQCVGDQVFQPLESTRYPVDAPLLFVQDSTQLFDESLQVRVARFDFCQALIVHGA